MNNTSSNDEDERSHDLTIAPMVINALNNPAINGSDYWNLTNAAFGSAGFHAAWAYSTGVGVTIGLVDEGVNYTHLDLAGNYNTAIDYDPRDDISDYDAMPDSDDQEHGTEVAGIIAGSGSNNFGTIGAAPDATITASYIRYGSDFSIDDIAQIMAHQASYDVSNNSWGFTAAFADNFSDPYFAGLAQGMADAASNGRGGLGTVLVFAGGNSKFVVDGENVGDDSNFHNLSNSRFGIAVGAHDSTGEAAYFSSPGTNILLSAPGVGLLTTSGDEYHSTDSSYVSGTSFAAPMVSSAVALMLQVNPNLGYRDVQEILAISSDPSRSGQTTTNGATNVNGGGLVFDREMGFGALNAEAAVNLARSWTGQHTAANEEHIAASFEAPESADAHSQTLTVDVPNPGTDGFSLDYVQLTLDLDDTDLGDLRIELTSPDGTKSLIAPNLHAAGGMTTLDFTFSSVETWGENPYGRWTLTLSHPGTSDDFVIRAASLDLYGDTTTSDNDYYFTASFERLVAADGNRSVITDANDGIDRLNFAAADDSVTVDLRGNGPNSIGATAFALDGSFEKVFGSVHNDHVIGSDSVNSINGDYGNDWIAGLGGDDYLTGGAGDDTLYGGAGADSIDGGAGTDTAAYSTAVTLDFVTGNNTGDAEGDTFARIERFSLSGDNDRFYGSLAAVNETVSGNGGDDWLSGGAGNDLLNGGTGSDTMVGGHGNDAFYVDSKLDRVIESFGDGTDIVNSSIDFTLGANVENLCLTGTAGFGSGNALANIIVGSAAANALSGLSGNDSIYGGDGNDTATGGTGNDNLVGGNGNDRLTGGEGRDRVWGGAGGDRLTGGVGADWLSGGAGNDVFVFSSANDSTMQGIDRISDFSHGHDKIDLRAIDASTKAKGDNSFHFVGFHNPGHKAGTLFADYAGKNTLVSGDVNGDGHADFAVLLSGHHQLVASDFIL